MWEDVFQEATKEASAVSSTVLKSALTEAKKGQGQGPTANQLQKLAEEELKKFEGARKSMFDKIFSTCMLCVSGAWLAGWELWIVGCGCFDDGC